MKKFYLLVLTFCAFCFTSQAQVEFVENFDSYDLGPISPQSENWRTWGANGAGTAEDAEVSDDEYLSPDNCLFIDDSEVMDPLFLIPGSPDSGLYTVQWYAFIPSGKSGYWNMQGGMTPAGVDWDQWLMGGNVYLNCDGNMAGQGGVTGVTDCSEFSAVFFYPEDEWFKVTCLYDLDNETWDMSINDVPQFNGYPFEFGTRPFESLAALDFYSASTNNHMYLDDLIGGEGVLSTEQFAPEVFSVYPNPVNDILNISTKSTVDKVIVYDILGKVVLEANPGTISPSINMSSLSSGTYMVKVYIENNSKIVKILK